MVLELIYLLYKDIVPVLRRFILKQLQCSSSKSQEQNMVLCKNNISKITMKHFFQLTHKFLIHDSKKKITTKMTLHLNLN
jgi:hypothetical protein